MRAYIIAAAVSTLLACEPSQPVPASSRGPHAPGAPEPAGTIYDIECALDPGESRLDCTETIAWQNTGPVPLDHIYLHLYLEAFRDPGTVYRTEGAEAGVEYEGSGGVDIMSVEADGAAASHAVDGTWLRVDLPAPLDAGAGVRLEVGFVSHLPPLVERTGCTGGFCFAGQWYPKVMRLREDGTWPLVPYHHNAEYDAAPARHEVRVTAPAGWTVAATGGADPVQTGPGGVTWAFGGDLKDVAFAAGSRMRILDGRDRSGRVEIHAAYPSGRGNEASRTMEILDRALTYVGEWFGPLPYPRLTVVIVPEEGRGAGGMEYPGLFTTFGADPEWSPVKTRDHVLYHELAHQVFFGMLDTDEGREPWIDEGFATFTGLRLQAAVEGGDVPRAARVGAVSLDSFEYLRAALVLDTGCSPSRYAAWDYGSYGEYGCAVYSRTALVLETARRVWGDEPMMRALGLLAHGGGGRRVSGADVERAFAGAYGEDFVSRYLVPALDSTVPLDIRVDAIGDGVTVSRTGVPVVPVDVLVTLASGREEILTWDGEGGGACLAAGQEPVVAAVVDPDGKILLDINRMDNGMDARGGSAGRPAGLAGLLLVIAQVIGQVVMP